MVGSAYFYLFYSLFELGYGARYDDNIGSLGGELLSHFKSHAL